MAIMKEFREFAIKGSVVDLAVGVIIGAAFGRLVDSLVKDLIMPVIGRVVGGLDFSNWFFILGSPPPGYNGLMTYDALTKAGVPLFAYGNFLTVAIKNGKVYVSLQENLLFPSGSAVVNPKGKEALGKLAGEGWVACLHALQGSDLQQ